MTFPRRLPPMLALSMTLILTLILGFAQDDRADAAGLNNQVNFARVIKPILARKCFACHGAETAESGLALHSAQTAFAKGDSGLPAIVQGKADSSELLRRISSEDELERMPPEGKPLSTEEINLIRQWIDEGAKWEKHWAFEPISRPALPEVQHTDWVRNDVDRFILSLLEASRLQPAKPASKKVLARRIYYDLIGLPPTPDELAEFLADHRPDAYERLVNKLLASPHYGERWARHWLDVVRYAESNSYERDSPKPNVWKYRDYVIQSLNDDKPYDQFVREQLAGDELDEVTDETMTATGYYRLGLWDDEPADPVQALADEMDELVSTTGQAFLGLTVGCARCHDHKIDPFPQADYYGFVAFMGDVTTYGTRADQLSNNQWSTAPTKIRARQDLLNNDLKSKEAVKLQLEQQAIKRMSGVLQRLTESDKREEVLRENLRAHLKANEEQEYDVTLQEITALNQEIEKLGHDHAVLALARTDSSPPATHIHVRGNPHVPGKDVVPHFPQILGGEEPEITPLGNRASVGRRRVLADWIASPENMLTSRVIANRVWQHHFGRGIVRSPNNFGQLGIPPTHPKLLDYLASYLTDHNWRLKSLHRLIVTSSAYRMSSEANPAGMAVDPDNNLFWRFDFRRLSAEEIRDSVLAVSGKLNRELYGPSIYPQLSQEVLATQSQPGLNWGDSTPEQQARRSVYIHVKRSLLMPLLTAFDLPDPDSSCEARFNTTQPAQAFAMLHSTFLHEQATDLAQRVQNEAGAEKNSQVTHALQLVLGREANQEEIQLGLDLITRLRNEHGQDANEALRYYCLALLNLNEFIYLD
ncbi:PSD1 and planctomycete cytochrome C domain-containing protein [Bythopirellula polymerisocia]|uniref:Planctomycete cytochrome C n=1 Tax=Bythopirellula polymerisocia TaxID=2528003 RepID=A0A5C6CXF1_9BACT|nr:PSD1 and planctomycete cytochrome C domain-containing protein [Bythopirellula polymerisocia]TWU27309.1 Planctomycete cytochrome C [Bythopirellula polymerisocia]